MRREHEIRDKDTPTDHSNISNKILHFSIVVYY